jgi:hypothetical protein
MTRIGTIFCAASVLLLPLPAGASELAPLQPGTFTLREHTASVYYTVQSESFEVVATIAPAGADGAPARFIAELMPGQTATLAVGAFDPSVPAAVLKLKRQGDELHAEIVPSERLAAK